MNMILYATNSQYLVACCIYKLAYITVDTLQMASAYLRTSGLYVEYYVQVYLAQ